MLNIDALFKGRHFDREIIVLCVRWYLRYKLSFRDLVEMMAERGLSLAHTTIMLWIQRYVPEFERRWNRFVRSVARSWRVDETYVKIKGRWTYLYRAVDKEGRTVDFLLRAKRDSAAAKAFFRRAFRRQGRLPHKITLDGYQASHRAAKEALGEHSEGNRCNIRSSKYLTDVFDKAFPNRHGGEFLLYMSIQLSNGSSAMESPVLVDLASKGGFGGACIAAVLRHLICGRVASGPHHNASCTRLRPDETRPT